MFFFLKEMLSYGAELQGGTGRDLRHSTEGQQENEGLKSGQERVANLE